MIITLAKANFTDKNINDLMGVPTIITVNYIKNTDNSSAGTQTIIKYGTTWTMNFTNGNGLSIPNGCEFVSVEPTSLSYVENRPKATVTCKVKVKENSGPVTPTNYTFTINPNPTSATVTLSATGYSTVSGTGSKSITVANGTKVNWRVEASGYTTRTGNWTISGGNKTENITLSASGGATSNYTLIHGNKYASGHETNTARASISPLTIIVPKGVTITNKSTIKWAYYTGVNTNNMPSGTGSGTWDDYKYTGTGAAIGISFKKVDNSAFDWSVDSTNPADYFNVSDEGLWNGTAKGEEDVPVIPDTPEGTLGDITTLTLVNGNPYGTTAQQTAKNRVHSETALYAPAGTVISCKDTTTYKWALRQVRGETNLASAVGVTSYKPDSAWTTKTSYTTETNGYWCFILLKASDADFDWSKDSNKVSDYFTVS